MKRYYLLSALLSATIATHAQRVGSNLNLDVEQVNPETHLPVGWWAPTDNGYTVTADSLVKHHGRYALRIQSTGTKKEGGFGVASTRLPINFQGKTMTLSGFIKTENVQNGYAGLWLRVDGPQGTLQLDNMSKQNVRGTTEWQAYSITLPLHEAAESVVLGGLLPGTGTMWLDQLELTVDGKPLAQALLRPVRQYKAEQDTAFFSGSGLNLNGLSKQQTENLAVLGRVWGFVKYYHPAVAAGEHNLDAALFRVLPQVLASSSTNARSQVLSSWVTSLGPVPACPTCREPAPDSVRLQPDLAWLTDKKQLSPDLSKQLVYLRRNRNQGPHYYVGTAPGAGNPVFQHEERYALLKTDLPDDGLRLLALYRYWNMIAYFFPYRYAIGEDWQQVLPELIPQFVAARTPEQYRLTALALIARIHDTHATISEPDRILTAYKGKYRAPVQVRFVEGQPVVTGYFDPQLGPATGLQKGDIVVQINGRKVTDLIAERRPITPASNEPTQLRNIGRELLRGSTEQVSVVVQRNGQELPFTLNRHLISKLNLGLESGTPDPKAPAWRVLPGNIGHLTLGTIKNKDLPVIMQEAQGTKGLIIDIRNYPSDFVVFALTKYLLTQPAEFARFSAPLVAYPGVFLKSNPLLVQPGESPAYTGKVVILVNELSVSNSEYTAMALRAIPGAMVMGSTTAGADGNVSAIVLPGNISTRISGLGVYYPDGRETQRVGIVPDVEVKPTIQGIREGRDEVLERAVAFIEAGAAN
ncbi:C-terminal processing protease CtpA/Prc [Hymenobacter luteus]|uniref:C-terminal processing protease CtpA/Prc n=2 Tax=Hymenobacter TaxID=89966 RepID=A0A7W9SYA1_9BACT|nr:MULTISPECIES: S41 family peptidase [Hymenobacter]MBB4599553.1 C-terminal processing protease CtpA/Prc [Hymenobacter latericoloratus]MBB6058137.1 C-terminal processing protease CtpA/Prc [Hymenobacter luteus]